MNKNVGIPTISNFFCDIRSNQTKVVHETLPSLVGVSVFLGVQLTVLGLQTFSQSLSFKFRYSKILLQFMVGLRVVRS